MKRFYVKNGLKLRKQVSISQLFTSTKFENIRIAIVLVIVLEVEMSWIDNELQSLDIIRKNVDV